MLETVSKLIEREATCSPKFFLSITSIYSKVNPTTTHLQTLLTGLTYFYEGDHFSFTKDTEFQGVKNNSVNLISFNQISHFFQSSLGIGETH